MSLVDYSTLEEEIVNAQEPKVLKVGTECKARIISVKSGISEKNDCKWYNVLFDVPDDPMVKEFTSFFWELDRDHLDAKQYERNLYSFKMFVKCFGVDLSRPFSWEDDLVGKEGWVIVGVQKDPQFGEKNTVSKYIVNS